MTDIRDLLKHFTDQYGLDIETMGTDVGKNQLLQVGVQTPAGKLFEVNVQQDAGYQLQRFHDAQKGRLGSYYRGEISGIPALDITEPVGFHNIIDEQNYRVARSVANKEKAQDLVRRLLSNPNKPANIIIHNAKFELSHFESWFGKGQSPIGWSEEYKQIIYQNRSERKADMIDYKSGRISADQVRIKDRLRQEKVYNQIIKEARKGNSIIDTMEIAKMMNAEAQKRGLISAGTELSIGTNVEFLSKTLLNKEELHRAAQDVAIQNSLAPKLVKYTEELRTGKTPTDPEFKKWIKAWENPVDLKVKSQTRAIENAIEGLSGKKYHWMRSHTIKAGSYQDVYDVLTETGKFKGHTTQGRRVADYGVDPSQIFKLAENRISGYHQQLLREMQGRSRFKGLPQGWGGKLGVAAGLLTGGYLLAKTAGISGNDEDYNTIEGLRHGWFGESRKYLTDFGSGYKGPNAYQEYVDPTPTEWGSIGFMAGTAGAGAMFWNKPVNIFGKTFDINKLSYIGEFPESASDFLGRKDATLGDLVYNAVRRSELAFAGIPKAFSVSTLMSPSILKDASFAVDLEKIPFDPLRGRSSRKHFPQNIGFGYKDYLEELTGKSLSGYTGVEFSKGKLFGVNRRGGRDVLLQEARLYQRIHAPGITKSVSQFAKSYESTFNIAGVGKEHDFLIAGGQSKKQAAMRAMHAYAHESVSKYLRLMDDPVKAFREAFPNINPALTRGVESFTRFMPKLGVGGERELVGGVHQLLGRHFKKAVPLLIGIPAAYGTLDWITRQIAPEDTVAGEAGITGLAAETARISHMTYARMSEVLGLTALRQEVEERAPGLTGIKPFIGFTLTGTIAGTALGMMSGLADEISAPAGSERYQAMVRAKTFESSLPGPISKIPGMRGAYSKAVKAGKYGALISGALSLPFLLTGLGSSKSVEELNEEYIEGKEVAVRKARWWEFGMTPWEGDRIMYYRPDWYNRLLARSEAKSIYQGEDISPVGKFVRTLANPYWLEEMHYEDRPYPVTGSSGEHLGIFGALYEWTLGRVLKPPAYMHKDEWEGGYKSSKPEAEPSRFLGGLEKEKAVTPYSLEEQIKQQYYTSYEALGLRGFVSSAIKQSLTGEQDVGEHTPILQSAADIDSARRKYWDLNLGGLLGLTEPYRRITPKRPYTTEYINPIENNMPDWMPGDDYYINFKTGDPFTKIAEGEYRLPGIGYAARYKELEGISPEKYPLIHKYKILADVAPYSKEFKDMRRKLQKYELTDYEQDIYNTTEEQIEKKREKKKFRDEVYQETMIGRYGAALTNIARSSPFEELVPLAPAHKLLPSGTAFEAYEESIYGKEFKLWQRPIDDFIKPFATTVGNLIGIDRIPDDISDARQIEEHFDQLEYIKNKRLEQQALARGATEKAKEYRKKMSSTLMGVDVYGNEFRLKAALPKRERVFFEEFKEASAEEKAKILELVPENTKDAYIAQWDKELLSQLQEGELEVTEEERYNLEREIYGRMAAIRARRQAAAEALENSESLPSDDWMGWRADVDLEDVKLKYLIQTGRDYHYYDLWDDRLRSLRRKPYLEEAMSEVNPFTELVPPISFADVYRNAAEAGIQNPTITLVRGLQPEISYDLEYEREDELKGHLRELGYVI